MTNWKAILKKKCAGDTIIACTLSNTELNLEFDNRLGHTNSVQFNAWSKNYVYSSDDYDRTNRIVRAPRNPPLIIDDSRCICQGFFRPPNCPVHGRH